MCHLGWVVNYNLLGNTNQLGISKHNLPFNLRLNYKF